MRRVPENLHYLNDEIRKLREQPASFDGGGGGGYDGPMEPRVAALEKFADESRKELRSIDVRLAKIEVLLEVVSKNMASKTDIAEMRTALANTEHMVRHAATDLELGEVKSLISKSETATLRWFLGTLVGVGGLAFAAARFFGS